MTAHAWKAEHPVDAALAHRLVAAQYPELAQHEPVRVGQGWDADVWAFSGIAFRFPRRAAGVPLIEVELRVLPALSALLPVAIPVPTHPGYASEAFPWPFYGHPLIIGRPADLAQLCEGTRTSLAPVLGGFLKALHAISPVAVSAPPDEFKWNMTLKARRAEERLPALVGAVDGELLAAARKFLGEPPDSRPDGPEVLLHGDVYVRHLILSDASELVGVIDWGDVRAGDPAIDLAIAYSFLPPEARTAFWSSYGEVDAATRHRARLTALANHGVSLLAYALDIKDDMLAAEAQMSLGYALL